MTYPVYWSRYQVLRDFIQNFYDTVGCDEWPQRFYYDYKDLELSMWVKGETFPLFRAKKEITTCTTSSYL